MDNRVAGIVAALVANYVVIVGCKVISDLTLALVAPLGSNQYSTRHACLLAYSFQTFEFYRRQGC